MIDISKKYRTSAGSPVRILCTDRPGSYPVVALVYYHDTDTTVEAYTREGKFYSHSESSTLDLVEVNEWDDLLVDDPVWVRQHEGENWKKRHFSGITDGKPTTWENGRTSWTAYSGKPNTVSWNFCRKAGDLT